MTWRHFSEPGVVAPWRRRTFCGQVRQLWAFFRWWWDGVFCGNNDATQPWWAWPFYVGKALLGERPGGNLISVHWTNVVAGMTANVWLFWWRRRGKTWPADNKPASRLRWLLVAWWRATEGGSPRTGRRPTRGGRMAAWTCPSDGDSLLTGR